MRTPRSVCSHPAKSPSRGSLMSVYEVMVTAISGQLEALGRWRVGSALDPGVRTTSHSSTSLSCHWRHSHPHAFLVLARNGWAVSRESFCLRFEHRLSCNRHAHPTSCLQRTAPPAWDHLFFFRGGRVKKAFWHVHTGLKLLIPFLHFLVIGITRHAPPHLSTRWLLRTSNTLRLIRS